MAQGQSTNSNFQRAAESPRQGRGLSSVPDLLRWLRVDQLGGGVGGCGGVGFGGSGGGVYGSTGGNAVWLITAFWQPHMGSSFRVNSLRELVGDQL
jgi:hypothetical protein